MPLSCEGYRYFELKPVIGEDNPARWLVLGRPLESASVLCNRDCFHTVGPCSFERTLLMNLQWNGDNHLFGNFVVIEPFTISPKTSSFTLCEILPNSIPLPMRCLRIKTSVASGESVGRRHGQNGFASSSDICFSTIANHRLLTPFY